MLNIQGQIQFSLELSPFQTGNMHTQGCGEKTELLMTNKNHLNFHIKEVSASFSKQGQPCSWSFGIAACKLGKKLVE